MGTLTKTSGGVFGLPFSCCLVYTDADEGMFGRVVMAKAYGITSHGCVVALKTVKGEY